MPARKPNMDFTRMASYHCPNDLCWAFVVTQVLYEPSLLDFPPGIRQQDVLIKKEAFMCAKCGGVWLKEQLKKLTPKEREIARAEMELKHVVRSGEGEEERRN